MLAQLPNRGGDDGGTVMCSDHATSAKGTDSLLECIVSNGFIGHCILSPLKSCSTKRCPKLHRRESWRALPHHDIHRSCCKERFLSARVQNPLIAQGIRSVARAEIIRLPMLQFAMLLAPIRRLLRLKSRQQYARDL